MEIEKINTLIEEIVRENYLVSDQVVEGTLNEMGLDSLDFYELIIDVEGELVDLGYKLSLDEGSVNLNMTIGDFSSAIHQSMQ